MIFRLSAEHGELTMTTEPYQRRAADLNLNQGGRSGLLGQFGRRLYLESFKDKRSIGLRVVDFSSRPNNC